MRHRQSKKLPAASGSVASNLQILIPGQTTITARVVVNQKMSRFMNLVAIFSKTLFGLSPIEMIGIDTNHIPHSQDTFLETDLLRRGMIRR